MKETNSYRKNLTKKSKFLSLILRHDPSTGNITLDKNGWALVSDLIRNSRFTIHELETIVETDNKQRYSFNDNKTKIRANQGHSIPEIDIKFEKVVPPKYLYHGTIRKYVNSIMEKGLKKQTRNYIHLSKDEDTAIDVGSRRGIPIILEIQSLEMHNDGYEFFISKNGVYLIEYVPPEYILCQY